MDFQFQCSVQSTVSKTELWGTPLVTGHEPDVIPFTLILWAQPNSQLLTEHTVTNLSCSVNSSYRIVHLSVRDSIKSFAEIKSHTHWLPLVI